MFAQAASSTPAAAAPAQQQDEGKGRAVLAFLTVSCFTRSSKIE